MRRPAEVGPELEGQDAEVLAHRLSCSRCQFVLDYDLLDQAELPETFQVVDDDPLMEQEYGND